MKNFKKYGKILSEIQGKVEELRKLEPSVIRELAKSGWSQDNISRFMHIGKVNINLFLTGRKVKRFSK